VTENSSPILRSAPDRSFGRIFVPKRFQTTRDAASFRGKLGAANNRKSGGNAQLLFDFGHHRVRQARLAEFRKVLGDDAFP
jgi:hypothetical protein